jgi:hypothetical protein
MRRTITVLMVSACAGLLVSACGGDKNTAATSAPTPAASQDCTHNGKYPPSPTVDSLTGLLNKGLDPAVPAADKIDLLQGAAGDPGLFDRMLPALHQANFAVKITDVTDYCNGTANADATLNFYGQSNQSQVPIVAEDGKWKLDRVWACGLAASLQLTSPICS